MQRILAHPKFLGFGRKLIENLGPGLVIFPLVGHQVECSSNHDALIRRILLRHVGRDAKLSLQVLSGQDTDNKQTAVLADILALERNDRAMEEIVDKVGQAGKKVLGWFKQKEEEIMSTATKSTQQQTVQDRERDEADCPKEEPVPKASLNTERMGAARALGEGIVQNRAVQVGVGVMAAAGAGLVLVSMFSVGAVAVAGAAGYLAYRELSGKRV